MLLSAAIVLVYTYLGGLTSAIYNEVLQFFLIVLGFAPLAILAVHRAGGWGGIQQRLPDVMTHAWKYVGHASENPMGVEAFGLVAGLGFVLSFGYWCTDFLVVQRAMAAESMSGRAAHSADRGVSEDDHAVHRDSAGHRGAGADADGAGYALPSKAGGGYDYDQALTTLMAQFYPSGHAGRRPDGADGFVHVGHGGQRDGLQYRLHLRHLSELHPAERAAIAHYLTVGRITTVVGVALSIATAYLAAQFNNIMDFLQLVFGFVNAPLFATFLLGMFWKRATGHGAFSGLLSGTAAAALTHGLTVAEGKGGWICAICTHSLPRWRRISGSRSSPGPPASWSRLLVSLATAAEAGIANCAAWSTASRNIPATKGVRLVPAARAVGYCGGCGAAVSESDLSLDRNMLDLTTALRIFLRHARALMLLVLGAVVRIRTRR